MHKSLFICGQARLTRFW